VSQIEREIANTTVPAVEGWFTSDPEPALLGTRCTECGTVFFPRAEGFCRNPACRGRELVETRLSRFGTVWSYTDARYQPPPPYIATTDPYEPFTLAAVELRDEALVVMGQLAEGYGIDDVEVGTTVELVIEPLFETAEATTVVWKWKPVAEGAGPSGRERNTGAGPSGRERGAAT
jgi:uncharacterized OB-fold protein